MASIILVHKKRTGEKLRIAERVPCRLHMLLSSSRTPPRLASQVFGQWMGQESRAGLVSHVVTQASCLSIREHSPRSL